MSQSAPVRISWIEATHGDPQLAPLWAFLRDEAQLLAAERAKIELVHLPIASGGIRTPANRLLNDAAVLAAAVAAAPSADAVVIGCWGAPTREVRAALNTNDRAVPVSSLPDASVQVMNSLARRAVIVTVAPGLVPIFEQDLAGLGASGFHAVRPVRAYAPASTHAEVVAALRDPSELIERFDAAACLAVEDGADAVVVGCGYLAPIFTRAGYVSVSKHADVPVVDCSRLALEHALLLCELQRAGIAASPRGYPAPQGAQESALRQAVVDLGRV